MLKQFEAIKIGDPIAEDTDLGPIARKDLSDDIHEQVSKSRLKLELK